MHYTTHKQLLPRKIRTQELPSNVVIEKKTLNPDRAPKREEYKTDYKGKKVGMDFFLLYFCSNSLFAEMNLVCY